MSMLLDRLTPDVRALLTDEEAEVIAAGLEAEAALARLDWPTMARPSQLPPDGDWFVWLILAGRGWGKTRTGAEWLKLQAMSLPGTEWVIAAPTFADVRDTCVEGPSGFLSVMPPGAVATYNRSLGEIDLANGSHVKLVSADEPDRFRGRNLHGAWCDELAAWRYRAAWDEGLAFAVRLGTAPRIVVTTTPKPTELLRSLVARDGRDVSVTRGSTFENAANLSAAALAQLQDRYGGTRLGRQELEGELLEDVEGALWTRDAIDRDRITDVELLPEIVRNVVAIDPAVTSAEDSDETGIVVAGRGADGHAYVFADRSLRASPEAWGRQAVDAHHEFAGDRIIGEANNGGDLVESVIRAVDRSVPYRKVTASRGKRLRAEPVAALYEQGRVHHVGAFPELEDQLCTWTQESAKSPDRMDALVWAITELMLGERRGKLRHRGAA